MARSNRRTFDTILLSSTANSVNVPLYEKLPYDPLKAFTHVSLALTTPYVMVVGSNLPAKTLKEFVALAKSKPGSLAYASAGNGSGSHLMAEMLAQYAQVNVLHVPYKGMAPAITDLLGGRRRFSSEAIQRSRRTSSPGACAHLR